MSYAELAEATGKSLSTIKRLATKDPAKLEQLVASVLDGSSKAKESEAPGTLAQFEGRFLATHTLLAILRHELRDSQPAIAGRFDAILAKTQPWVAWLDSD